MDCDRANLPPEMLSLISTNLQSPNDVTRFRWVCRSWRFSTSLPNILSPLFPRTLISSKHLTINATSVYLLRPRFDPSKAWLLSLQEAVTGNLIVRHALTYREISNKLLNLLDPSNFWISVTEIAKSYAINTFCNHCNRISSTNNLELVPNVAGFCSTKLLGLGKIGESDSPRLHLFAFSLGLSGETRIASRVVHSDQFFNFSIEDFVKFNGRIYAVNIIGQIFVFDPVHIKLHKICYNLPVLLLLTARQRRFVVSDGDLYLVSTSYDNRLHCRVYRLDVDEVDLIISRKNRFGGDILNTEGKRIWECEEVVDLEERVFFIAKNCSFSISAQDLPHSCRPNCIVYVSDNSSSICGCDGRLKQIIVFHLGRDVLQVETLEGYTHLLSPPLSWIDDQLKREFARKENFLANWLA